MDFTHITKTELLSRAGWTATLVARLLGEPDQRKKVLRRSAFASLYAVARVEQAEAGAEFASAQAAIARRHMAAEKAVVSKTAKLMAAIQSMPITVRRLGLSSVKQGAVDSYNMRSRGDAIAGKTGIARAVTEIRRRVYSAIAQAYPALSDECARQKEVRA